MSCLLLLSAIAPLDEQLLPLHRLLLRQLGLSPHLLLLLLLFPFPNLLLVPLFRERLAAHGTAEKDTVPPRHLPAQETLPENTRNGAVTRDLYSLLK
jgi:hypothetical protein